MRAQRQGLLDIPMKLHNSAIPTTATHTNRRDMTSDVEPPPPYTDFKHHLVIILRINMIPIKD